MSTNSDDLEFLDPGAKIERLVTWGLLLGGDDPIVESLCLATDPSGNERVLIRKKSHPIAPYTDVLSVIPAGPFSKADQRAWIAQVSHQLSSAHFIIPPATWSQEDVKLLEPQWLLRSSPENIAAEWRAILEAWESYVARQLLSIHARENLLPVQEALAFHTRLLNQEGRTLIKGVMEQYEREKANLRPKQERLLAMLKRLGDIERSVPERLKHTELPTGEWDNVAELLTKLSGEEWNVQEVTAFMGSYPQPLLAIRHQGGLASEVVDFMADGGSIVADHFRKIEAAVERFAAATDPRLRDFFRLPIAEAEEDYNDREIPAYDPRLPMPKRGLHCSIYRPSVSDRSNGGLSSKKNFVTLLCRNGTFEPSEDAPAIKMVRRKISGKEYVHAEPVEKIPESNVGYMAGGAFIYSRDENDGGFQFEKTVRNGGYPISLHDRT